MADGIQITAGSGTTVQTDDVGGVHYQRVKRSVGADGLATDFLDKASRSDTFTTAANGTTVDVSAQGMCKFSLQVKQTGTVTSWTVVLEGSLDGTNFQTILTHTKANNLDGGIIGLGSSASPYLYFRSRCAAISLGGGTNIVVTIVGKP